MVEILIIDSYEVVARVTDGFGVEAVPAPTTRATQDGLKKVGFVEVADCPQPGVTSWATVAASFFPSSHQTSDGRPVCVEFVAGIDARWQLIGDAIASCAFQINESNDVGPGVVYRNAISNLFPQTKTPHLLAVPPFLWNDFVSYSDEDAYVTQPFFKEIIGGDVSAVVQRLRKDSALVTITAAAPPKKYAEQSPLQVAVRSGQFAIATSLAEPVLGVRWYRSG